MRNPLARADPVLFPEGVLHREDDRVVTQDDHRLDVGGRGEIGEALRQIESCDVVNLVYNKARAFPGAGYYGYYYS